jgi:hypothetical protein
MYVTIVKINAILPVVNADLRDLKEIRVLWDHKELKEIPDVPVQRVTKETQVIWDHRVFLVFPEREDQEEIQDQ